MLLWHLQKKCSASRAQSMPGSSPHAYGLRSTPEQLAMKHSVVHVKALLHKRMARKLLGSCE